MSALELQRARESLERGTPRQKSLGVELCESEFQVLSSMVPRNSKLTINFDVQSGCCSAVKGMAISTVEIGDMQLQHACFSGRLKTFEHRIQFYPISKDLKAHFLNELGVELEDSHELLMTCELVQGQEVINCSYEEGD